MSVAMTVSSEEKKLSSSFEEVRRQLAQPEYASRLDKPLAYWALPNDRRLPLAFLGRSIGDLIATPFDELLHTRGVGQKKIGSLVRLLNRAIDSELPSTPFGIPDLTDPKHAGTASASDEAEEFDPSTVSELRWSSWCATVKRFGLEGELLGRLAPSLEPLPTVIWRTPIREYANRSLDDIRKLKTHGEKRVRVVLEVFYGIDRALREVGETGHFGIRLIPKFVSYIESHLSEAIANRRTFTKAMLDEYLVAPILHQIRLDSGEMIYTLTRQRLGYRTPQRSVRDQAHELGVTRARVYQMLEDCGKIMAVRWPEGRVHLRDLSEVIASDASATLRLLRQLLFPGPDAPEDEEPMRTTVVELSTEGAATRVFSEASR